MKLAQRIGHAVVDVLNGSCQGSVDAHSMLAALYNLNKISDKSFDQLASTARANKAFDKIETIICEIVGEALFECESCGWWCETGEQTDEGCCSDCAEDY